MTSSPESELRREMIRRIDAGWDIEGGLGVTEMTLTHIVRPPIWRIAVEFLNPLTWLGGPSIPVVTRRLHVWADKTGRLHRRTTGDLPRGWHSDAAWEVPDGPIDQ